MKVVPNAEIAIFLQRLEDILVIEDADDLIQVAVVNRNAREAAVDKIFRDLREGGVNIDRMDLSARLHDGFDRSVGKLENAVDQFLLGFIENAFGGAFADQRFHLVDGDKARAICFLAAEESKDDIARRSQCPDDQRICASEQFNGSGSEASNLLGKAQSKRFRH